VEVALSIGQQPVQPGLGFDRDVLLRPGGAL
jgi:hypothetical protein